MCSHSIHHELARNDGEEEEEGNQKPVAEHELTTHDRYYTNFLLFFQNEIDNKGWQAVLREYLFQGDARSEDMLIRMFGGELTNSDFIPEHNTLTN